MDITADKHIPVHVSIIMDGNGRWAAQRGKERLFGHTEGAESVRACTEAAVEAGVKYLSLFAFSEENWARPEGEVSGLMSLMLKSMKEEYHTLMDNGVRFRVLGNRERLSDSVREGIEYLEAETSKNEKLTMILFLSYSGKWDILQAAKRIAAEHPDPASVTEEEFSKYLVTAGIPDPDLLIRTSGELRISNYLLWQSAYTEFYFTPVLWPDFRKPQFMEALETYATRDRRYGKVK